MNQVSTAAAAATQTAADAIRPFRINFGRHFAAWEQPKRLSDDAREAFRALR